MQTAIQFPGVLFRGKTSVEDPLVPASRLVCCTSLIPPPPPPPEVTVKFTPLLDTPFTLTTTLALPVGTPVGTDVAMLVAVQLVVVAIVPPNVTVPVAPKFDPVIVTEVPTGPEVGLRAAIVGP